MKKLFTLAFLAFVLNATAQIPTNGLVGYYPFNGNANDASGSDNHGTVYGAALTTDRFGSANSAYQFDGIDDYIACGFNNLPADNTPRTISFWILSDTYPLNNAYNNHTGVSYGFNSLFQDNEVMFYRDASNIDYIKYAGYQNDLDLQVTYDTMQWYHVAVTYADSVANIYFNDSLLGTGGFPNWNTVLDSLRFGTHPDKLFYLDGKIDDVAIYNVALSLAGIDSLYNAQFTSVKTVGKPQNNLTVFPNPCTGLLKVQTQAGTPSIAISDCLGRIVRREIMSGSTATFDLSNEVSGIHFVELQDANCNSLSRKLFILQ